MTPKFSNIARVLALLALSAAVALAAGPSAPDETESRAWSVLDVRSADGEQCLVCGRAVHDGDMVELRYKGRRFHVAAAMLGQFEADPERYFDSLEAHSALFDEAAPDGPQMQTGWLVFGVYVLAGLVAAALCGYLAMARGRPATPWFVAGLVTNVFAVAALLLTPRGDLTHLPAHLPGGVPAGLAKIPTTRSPVSCPTCRASNHPAAARCGVCGAALNPSIEAEAARL